MKNFVGIDLGTTNSAICSYDGSDTRVWKSPQQNDVTPSAIYIDRRGNKQVGFNAYNMALQSPDNSAMLFKRLMGTSTPINLPAVNMTMTPEECSAEILKVLFGYLPEEIRNDPDSGWDCDRGYTKVGNKCVKVNVPLNAHIDVYGSGWDCDRGFRKVGNGCVEVDVPANTHIDVYGSGWDCDRGFRKVGNECIKFTVPENAHVDVYGSGWDCDRGYQKVGDKCVSIFGQ